VSVAALVSSKLASVEDMAFDGGLSPPGGALCPDPSRPGLGLEVRWADLEDSRVYGSRRRPF
jgi:hypothetical protein